mmetsp:Transcript_37425/g.69819  ORF Transcript_37425/g.69819 Transcript_37425/m.69819 type:complete len:141 (-) Transcript_37425:65-487(-)
MNGASVQCLARRFRFRTCHLQAPLPALLQAPQVPFVERLPLRPLRCMTGSVGIFNSPERWPAHSFISGPEPILLSNPLDYQHAAALSSCRSELPVVLDEEPAGRSNLECRKKIWRKRGRAKMGWASTKSQRRVANKGTLH